MSKKDLDENMSSGEENEFENDSFDESVDGIDSDDFDDALTDDFEEDGFSLDDEDEDLEGLEDDESDDFDELEEDDEDLEGDDGELEEDDDELDDDDELEEDDDELDDDDELEEDDIEIGDEEDEEDEDSEDEGEEGSTSPDDSKNKVILGALGLVFVGAIGFVGYNVVSMMSPSSVTPAPNQDMSGLSGSSSIGSADFSASKQQSQGVQPNSSGMDDEISGLLGLSESRSKDDQQEAQQSNDSKQQPKAGISTSSSESSANGGQAPKGQPKLDFGIGEVSSDSASQAVNQSAKDQSGEKVAYEKADKATDNHVQLIKETPQGNWVLQKDFDVVKSDIESMKSDFNDLSASQLGATEVRSIMNSVLSNSDLVTAGYVQREISKIEVPQGNSLSSVTSNGSSLSKAEIEEMLSLRIQEGLASYDQKKMHDTAEIDSLTKQISKLEMQIRELSSKETASNNKPSGEASETKKESRKYSLADLHGRERLAGFKIVGTEKDGSIALTSAPSGKVFKFFAGERIILQGKGTFTVKALLNDGKVFLVGEKYFIDTTYVPISRSTSTRSSSESEQVSRQKPSPSKSETPNVTEDYIIAPSKPGAETDRRRYTPRQSSSVYEQRERSSESDAPEGWSFNGGRVDQSQYLIRKPNGKWGIVEKGEQTEIGVVKGLNRMGDLVIGNYTLNAK